MGSRKFSMVSPAIWRPGRFLALGDPSAQLLYVYFLTCEHQTSAGCFRLPDGYACSDLGWSIPIYQAARDTLVEADMIAFDPDTSTIYVKRWFQHCAAMSDKHAKGIAKVIGDIGSDEIRELVAGDFSESEAERRGVNAYDTPAPGGSSRLLATGFMNGRR